MNMRKVAPAVLAAFGSIMIGNSTSYAHHSTAMFAWGELTQLKNARVVRWEWTNPHTFLYVTAQNGGEEGRWTFEGMSPSHLSRNGWTRQSLRPGDQVDLTFYALRDGRRGGFNVGVTFPDGRELLQLPVPQE